MEPWELRTFVEGILEKEGLYVLYVELCQKVDTPPVSKEAFTDAYVDVIARRRELFSEATRALDQDKRLLLETLEKAGAPLEDLASVGSLPPSVTVTLNDLSDGVICLYVIFPSGPDKPNVIPAHVSKGRESTFI
jgi:hypothetical protein